MYFRVREPDEWRPFKRISNAIKELAECELYLRPSQLVELTIPLTDKWLTEYALRLASCPESIAEWVGCECKARYVHDRNCKYARGLDKLMQNKKVFRLARYTVLLVDRYLRENNEIGPNVRYGGWQWPQKSNE